MKFLLVGIVLCIVNVSAFGEPSYTLNADSSWTIFSGILCESKSGAEKTMETYVRLVNKTIQFPNETEVESVKKLADENVKNKCLYVKDVTLTVMAISKVIYQNKIYEVVKLSLSEKQAKTLTTNNHGIFTKSHVRELTGYSADIGSPVHAKTYWTIMPGLLAPIP
jgi:hypothetical protein